MSLIRVPRRQNTLFVTPLARRENRRVIDGTVGFYNRTHPPDPCALTGTLFLNGLEELGDWWIVDRSAVCPVTINI